VIQAIADVGKLDNTLVIYISGDNGASPEGGLHGLFNEFAAANAVNPTVEQNMKFYDAWGLAQRILGELEVRKLIDAAHPDRDRLMLEVGYFVAVCRYPSKQARRPSSITHVVPWSRASGRARPRATSNKRSC
jgi:hypothetical protein